MMSDLYKKALLDFAVSLAKHVLPKLPTKGVARARKRFTLFSEIKMQMILLRSQLLENSGLLIDGATDGEKKNMK